MGMGDTQWKADEATADIGGFEEGDSGPISDFRDLDVWKAAMDLVTLVYTHSRTFPNEERYGLTSQIRRCSVSVPANIAEGYGRGTSGAYVQFLRVALGSAKELETLIELARRLNFLTSERALDLNTQTLRIEKMLRSLIRSIERFN
jgi:four helix bundle protein